MLPRKGGGVRKKEKRKEKESTQTKFLFKEGESAKLNIFAGRAKRGGISGSAA